MQVWTRLNLKFQRKILKIILAAFVISVRWTRKSRYASPKRIRQMITSAVSLQVRKNSMLSRAEPNAGARIKTSGLRSEERRVGKERRCRWRPDHQESK